MATTMAGVAVAGAVIAPGSLDIRVLSNRADLITGGDALVEVARPPHTDADDIRVNIDRRDVTSEFAVRADGRYLGLVTGLKNGENRLTASLGDRQATIAVTNHPIGGPVLSGPQVTPWVCETEKAGLGPAQDAQCDAPTKVDYLYKSTSAQGGALLPYDVHNPPTDVTTTTTDQGKTVPYIVRRETGTANRGMYQISVISDPRTEPKPWAGPEGWNRKLYYIFQGGAAAMYRQGVVAGTTGQGSYSFIPDFALSRGFAVATSTLGVGGQNTNTVVSAEALMMAKERIAEEFGEIRYTMSTGCSGGSVQQHVISDTYPGLLDGILPSCGYEDWLAFDSETVDCSLFDNFWNRDPGSWSADDREAVMGGSGANCGKWKGGQYARMINDPRIGCTTGPTGVEPDWVYDPRRNPDGTRCTFWDQQVSIYGERDKRSWGPVEHRIGHGFANRPVDNVGVQYGLEAVESGKITPEQFVALNEQVGGYDIDMNWTRSRSTADPAALSSAYRTFSTSGAHLATVPIIDYRVNMDQAGHPAWRSDAVRRRLIKVNGNADNQVIWKSGTPFDPFTGAGADGQKEHTALTEKAFATMDRWLTAIEADESGKPLAAKVVADKPADAVDTCWINGVATTDQQKCAKEMPNIGNPRMVAGGPLSDDVLKCQIKPLGRSDYRVKFTDDQWRRLQRTFPDGVCDYGKPSVGYQLAQPWLTFRDGPGGRPLGDPPRSTRA
ncbi:DUF6351 family protein [Amycolatopsis pigmentata]|uniref:DUF6351 family protein n=1 Tax=Amycolatopsis pigmentata TaxID=450801 RepID=A0ABW5FPF8_9PSEU